MAVNKVIYDGNTLIDITDTTAEESDVASGKYFYTADGVKHEGSASGGDAFNWDGFNAGSFPCGNIELSDSVTSIGDYRYYNRSGITGLYAPSVTSVGAYAFWTNSYLKSIYLPNVTTIATYAFYRCYRIEGAVHLSECTSIGTYGLSSIGSSATTKPTIVLPKITTLSADSLRQASTSAIDCGKNLASLPNRVFYNTSYPIIILRRTSGVVTASAANSIGGISSSTKVYVPSALIDSYKSASNWSAKGSIFYPIEGSEYENYYADGTAIS